MTQAVTHDERLGRLEVRIDKVEVATQEVRQDMREVQKTVWKAAGAVGVLVFICPIILKILKVI